MTAYGPKTREGLADLIDNETGAPELREALKETRRQILDIRLLPNPHAFIEKTRDALLAIEAAIAKAEGRK